jgi:putative tryptophan/tyrosine transport system substrate-binding protein
MRRRDFIIFAGGLVPALPFASHAQDAKRIPVIGVLWHAADAEAEGPYFKALAEGFHDLGYVQGRNILFEHRFPNETPERFRAMAAELVSLKPDVLVSVGVAAAPYLKSATTTIPLVFTLVADPIGMKLVDNLARPSGNTTGLSTVGTDLAGKRFELLKEIVPGISRVALLINPNERTSLTYVSEGHGAAAKLGLGLDMFEASTQDELPPAFSAMASAGTQALLIPGGGLFFQARVTVAKLGLTHRIPIYVWSRESLEAGALLSYGPDYISIVRRASVYVDKILKGTRPSDLPVEQPTRFQLLINQKTATTLGLDVPSYLQQLADEVIE